MKTKIIEEKQEFPALFIGYKDNTVLLVISEGRDRLEGVVLSTEGDENFIGEISSSWDKSSFEPFHGSITLES